MNRLLSALYPLIRINGSDSLNFKIGTKTSDISSDRLQGERSSTGGAFASSLIPMTHKNLPHQWLCPGGNKSAHNTRMKVLETPFRTPRFKLGPLFGDSPHFTILFQTSILLSLSLTFLMGMNRLLSASQLAAISW